MRRLMLALVLTAALAAPAGVAAAEELLWGVYGGAEAGALFFDLRDLNDYLDDARVLDFPSTVPTVGLNFQGVLGGRFHLGWNGHMFSVFQQGMAADAQFAGAFSDFFIGYDVVAHPAWRLRPELGLGGAVLALRLEGITGQIHDVTVPGRNDRLDFTQAALVGRAGVAIEWTPAIYRHENGLFGLAVSLSAGIHAPLVEDDWEIVSSGPGEDQDLTGAGPDVRFLAGYARLGVRFGGGITETD